MFEQLNDTQSFSAETKNRRNYFLITTVLVGITLVSAMIISLFAVDLDLGMGDSDMVELVAPVEIDQQVKLPDNEPTQPQKSGSAGAAAPKVAVRQVNMARIDESPSEIPKTVATTQNTSKARFDTGFKLGDVDSDPGAGGQGRSTSGDGSGDGDGIGDGTGNGDNLCSAQDGLVIGNSFDDAHKFHFWSYHQDIANFLLADSAVRNLRYEIDYHVFQALATRAGGENTSVP